ncbi:uncharacterized protein LOC126641228 isoform X2 [Myiozetetes cayanensis]|uniref:uncharacterized protein LOC126641228 isoform X2 n=1 Tax=Myiozetetes cayanensis TaxID=478635 RepID=UPI00215F3894|nr:uncharacterized protein LOC126641228 isoform X2 [Myiozetetes cayanensis]
MISEVFSNLPDPATLRMELCSAVCVAVHRLCMVVCRLCVMVCRLCVVVCRLCVMVCRLCVMVCRLYVVVCRLCVVVCRLCVVVCRLCVMVCRLCMTVWLCSHVWLCAALCGFPWLWVLMGVAGSGCAWLCSVVMGLLWGCCEVVTGLCTALPRWWGLCLRQPVGFLLRGSSDCGKIPGSGMQGGQPSPTAPAHPQLMIPQIQPNRRNNTHSMRGTKARVATCHQGCHYCHLPLLPPWPVGQYVQGFPPALFWGVPRELRRGSGGTSYPCHRATSLVTSLGVPEAIAGVGKNPDGLGRALGCREVELGRGIPTSSALRAAQPPSTSPPGAPLC